MHYLPIILGIAGVAALVFGGIGIVKYNQLIAADSTVTTEKNIIWWGSVIMILLGIFVMVCAAVIYFQAAGVITSPVLAGSQPLPSQVASPKSLSPIQRTATASTVQRATVATSPM